MINYKLYLQLLQHQIHDQSFLLIIYPNLLIGHLSHYNNSHFWQLSPVDLITVLYYTIDTCFRLIASNCIVFVCELDVEQCHNCVDEQFINIVKQIWRESQVIVLDIQNFHSFQKVTNALKQLHTQWIVSTFSNKAANVRRQSVLSRTKVRLFATSLMTLNDDYQSLNNFNFSNNNCAPCHTFWIWQCHF